MRDPNPNFKKRCSVEEIFKKYIKQSTPTPTPNPTPEPPVKKTYNNEQLYKQFKSNKGQNFFEKLGFTE